MRSCRSAAVVFAAALAAHLTGSAGTGAATTSSREEIGDLLWRERARGFASKQLDPSPALEALAAWEEALVERPGNVLLRSKVMQAIYFRAHFLGGASVEPKLLYDRLVELAEETVELAASSADPTDRARAHFWAAAGWALWGEAHSSVKAGARGVAGKIRRHASDLIAIDPEFADAGGMRMLGRLHTVAPKVVFFTGWIDRERGIELLREAHSISTRDGRNALFLAEALLQYRPNERREALDLLAEACALQPDPTQLVEESEAIEEACATLQRLDPSAGGS